MNATIVEEKSLFDRLGGMGAIEAAVDLFYSKVTADPTISPFFENVDMSKQRAKQKMFLAYAFGAPIAYTGKELTVAHAQYVADGLNDDHFDAVAGHLSATLDEMNVPGDLIDEVMTIAASTRDAVLGR